MNNSPAVPIKVVNPNNIHSTSHRQVVKGRGITTATAAIPQLRGKIESSKKYGKYYLIPDLTVILRSSKDLIKHPLTCITDFIHGGGRPAMVFLRPLKLVTCY